MDNILFDYISKYMTLTNDEKQVITDLNIFRQAKKGTILLEEGKYSKEGYFVLKGCIHLMNAWQTFVNTENEKINNGFQIFNTYRLGYHFKLLNDRFFIQPSLAITHRPYHTEMPNSFKQLDDEWSKFFFAEPGFHFGFNF
jgi:hypothetical protein